MPVDPSLVAFAFTAGVFTFFAPCAYPLLPGYVSYYLGRGAGADDGTAGEAVAGTAPDGGAVQTRGQRVARAVRVGTTVSLGFFLVYGVLAGAVVAVGARALSDISVLELIVGGLLIALGAPMAAGWKPSAPAVRLPERRRSTAGYFGFGVLYAAAAAGCTAPVFIAVALRGLSAGAVGGAATLGAYAAGMSVLMIGLTVAAAFGRETLLRRFSRHSGLVYRIAGVLLIVAGLVQIYFFLFRFDGLRVLGLA